MPTILEGKTVTEYDMKFIQKNIQNDMKIIACKQEKEALTSGCSSPYLPETCVLCANDKDARMQLEISSSLARSYFLGSRHLGSSEGILVWEAWTFQKNTAGIGVLFLKVMLIELFTLRFLLPSWPAS